MVYFLNIFLIFIFRTTLRNSELPQGFYHCRHILGNVLVNFKFKILHVFKIQTDSPRVKKRVDSFQELDLKS